MIEIGDFIRLKSSIKSRPLYFNSEGEMDFMLEGKTAAKVINITTARYLIKGLEDGGQTWSILKKDVVLVMKGAEYEEAIG